MPLTDDHPPMGSSISGMLFLAPGDSTTLPTAPRQQREVPWRQAGTGFCVA
jgi:hypothetical protein